ncbi:MAG: formylglycine-generating enzyme family protein [Planctomycetaceae bacterium]|nr:formylglycine-generating enzyme family protein [Planctomycetaceae bacterium]
MLRGIFPVAILVLVSCVVAALAFGLPLERNEEPVPVPLAAASSGSPDSPASAQVSESAAPSASISSGEAAAEKAAAELLPDFARETDSNTEFDENQPLLVEAPHPAPPGMVWIPGGTFLMGTHPDGTDSREIIPSDEQPQREVELDGFFMDATEVTNREFLRFTEATGYVTVAEKAPRREDFIGQVEDVRLIPEENLVAGSICFNPDFDRTTLHTDHPLWPYQVWQYVKGANWRHPHGPETSITDLLDHPVVHVAWTDAIAYCEWAGKALPTEAEWEYAARDGREGNVYPWGNERRPEGKWMHNIWQGQFPEENAVTDGYRFSAAVGTFPPGQWGLYDMSGNVWEWCADWYRPNYYSYGRKRNPRGPHNSYDPQEPGLPKRRQRGGSFMCSDNYCIGYRCSARMKGTPDSGAFHTGFRCVVRPADSARWQAAVERQKTVDSGSPEPQDNTAD